MRRCGITSAGSLLLTLASALRYDQQYVGYNINTNDTAVDPLDYWGAWPNHDYYASPSNWRMPMYTLFVDRFVNGDPTNDNANGTQFEHDILSTQLRYGGDTQGLQDTLDYIQGMGVKTLYLAGSPMLNMPWESDGYSPLDHTLLDSHFGNIQAWRDLITDIHNRGMYVIFDNTFATMGDLIGFQDYLNTSTPFDPDEHNVIWKSDRRYHDFTQSDDELDECTYPRFWGDDGRLVTNETHYLVKCRDSEFDQYGEVASFGNYPEWQRQLSKFAFVQDRLREWRPSVLAKLQHFSCMVIASLDIDGFRIDKGVQVTVDAQGAWSSYIRQCASEHNKNNFYIPGEIVTGNSFGAIYVGRGMEPEMAEENITAVVTTDKSTTRTYIRDLDNSALDAAAFHYSVYRAMTRFLGLDGIYAAEGDPPVNFVETWNALLQTNDMSNGYTGAFDPRHMYGVSNQDVFRWPGIQNGTEKNLLGLYIVTLMFPGIPTLEWGEEQAMYVLESTNANYVFGRPPMSSSRAWQMHGCYKVGSIKYANFPLDQALYGCEDDNVSLDHRDPSHPVRNVIKTMFEMRQNYPVLNDGYYLQQLSNNTYDIYLPNSGGTPTEMGLWSVYRSAYSGVQDFSNAGGAGQQSVWLLYTNENTSSTYQFDCNGSASLVAPFVSGTTVKNLFAPYEEYNLQDGSVSLGLEGDEGQNGCIAELGLQAWEFKAFVPKESWIQPSPVITQFFPGHDYRINAADGDKVHIKIGFSQNMDCDQITNTMQINSTTQAGETVSVDIGSIQCIKNIFELPTWIGQPTTGFTWEADLLNVYHGVHQLILNNISSELGNSTNSKDKFLLRVGHYDNPIVFPGTANYSSTILTKDENNVLTVSHSAPGADLWRYSLNFGTTYSDWAIYQGGNSTLAPRVWSGTKEQAWEGDHVIVQYWSRLGGSSDHYVHGDYDFEGASSRRFPQLYMEGSWNQYGYDSGVPNEMKLDVNGSWNIKFLQEWPAQASLNAWGLNPDGTPDKTQVFGDVDGDFILDRIPPQSLLDNVVNMTDAPPAPYLTYHFQLNDGDLRFQLIPAGSQTVQIVLYFLLATIPVLNAAFAAWMFKRSFYQIKFNKFGIGQTSSVLPSFLKPKFVQLDDDLPTKANDNKHKSIVVTVPLLNSRMSLAVGKKAPEPLTSKHNQRMAERNGGNFGASIVRPSEVEEIRRTVLIATMEYDIEDWNIKIKIGGLGVMAQLMGKNLGYQDLIWVVPCVGGVDYPDDPDEIAESMEVTILEQSYSIHVRLHQLRNITYVLLDAPIFRQQTKAEPYPPRMDDLASAIYYSAWNSCIAETIRRFKPDLYHINDYHGAAAPLHLLPDTIPCALSLHNAEFQGLWPMRTKEERNEVCRVYDLDPEIVQEYVQFGEVFNLLHAAASYLRVHQNGFGAVGVSRKYGKRSYARYPIFWGLKSIGALPNPDPTDTADWQGHEIGARRIRINKDMENARAGLREEAQKWAGLKIDPHAELFVFVGRWSMQKGIDLIADIFPQILEQYPRTQLICIGPVIDLYGKFAAIKLERLMKIFPGRVYSKPEFTALPPYIFSGAEFALIPSRDEPFGLVAVEFGRKGALGVGARVGGLGQMPGWWYTVESTATKHLLNQFKGAIETALATPQKLRAELRARSAKQRFPVADWKQKLETLQSTAIIKHDKYAAKGARKSVGGRKSIESGRRDTAEGRKASRNNSGHNTPRKGRSKSVVASAGTSAATSRRGSIEKPMPALDLQTLQKSLKDFQQMGAAAGPGHDDGGAVLSDPPSDKDDSDDDFYGQMNPALNDTGGAPTTVLQDDFDDDFYEQANPALKGDLAPVYPEDSLQGAFQRSLGGTTITAPSAARKNDFNASLSPEPVTFKPYLNDSYRNVQPVPKLRELPMISLAPAGKRPLLASSAGSSPPGSTRSSVYPRYDRDLPSPGLPTPSSRLIDFDPARNSRHESSFTQSTESSDRRKTAQSLTPTLPNLSRTTSTPVSKRESQVLEETKDLSHALAKGNSARHSRKHSKVSNHMDHVDRPKSAMARSQSSVALSISNVVGESGEDLNLTRVDPFFNDTQKDYQKVFERKLVYLNSKNTYESCIEAFIEKSEKDWFNRLRELKLGKDATPAGSIFRNIENKRSTKSVLAGRLASMAAKLDGEKYTSSTRASSIKSVVDDSDERPIIPVDPEVEFAIEDDYEAPKGCKKLLLFKFGDWPLYSILLAFGQIIAANSYQITLLTGAVGEAATKLYVIATIYLVTSMLWWAIYRTYKSFHVLSLPFLFYGFAFFLIGCAAITNTSNGKNWVQNIATACYAIASSSGSLFFALNFGDQGGAPVTSWVFRACVIQGTQQIYIAALWWWGSNIAKASVSGAATTSFLVTHPGPAVAVGWGVALLLWTIGILLHKGLPSYYGQAPGHTTNFFRSIFRRKIVLWFFLTVLVQNFFLSAPYGRNWLYLWSSQHAPGWAVMCLVLFFFAILWAAVLYVFNGLSKAHSWILPIFAIGLGAPRWAQMLWAVSGVGVYVPWAGGHLGSAIAGRCLWLWLGVLDAFQGVGFGMILLHTLTRFHISFTLIAAQVLGSIATICARGFAPDNIGPGPVFPNFATEGIAASLSNAWFWIGLLSQLVINVLAFMYFRKEQLNKP